MANKRVIDAVCLATLAGGGAGCIAIGVLSLRAGIGTQVYDNYLGQQVMLALLIPVGVVLLLIPLGVLADRLWTWLALRRVRRELSQKRRR
jgi:hypothetical protein